ncbi:hypothetical protein [Rhizobium sp. NXC24]|uniref:hypothetical protein n=1 Tax=Rhizobium sp. NXC24 TaxID=2048897 RepID=UPI00131A5BD7|nr:hypothetical protein [Rhizobium sp. NXC24]
MTQILNVTRNDGGQYEVTDQRGNVVEGPFETNAAAWKALDRLDTQAADIPDRRRSNKRVLWGKPDKAPKQSKKGRKRAAKQEKQMKRNAAKAVGWVRNIAAVKFDPAGNRAYRDHRLGTFGAASEVKRIDPAAYLAEKGGKL